MNPQQIDIRPGCLTHLPTTRTRLLFILVVSLGLCPAFAQDKPQLNTSMIPSSASIGIVAFPKSIAENPRFRTLPREVFSALGKTSLGFDPMKIRQATFVMPTPDLNSQQPPEWGLLMQFGQIQGLSDEFIKKTESTKIAGRKAYLLPRQQMGFLVFNESTLLLGSPGYLKKMATEADGVLAELAAKSQLKGDAIGFINLKNLRSFFQQINSTIPDLPGDLNRLRDLPELLDDISFSFTVKKRMEMVVNMSARDADAAKEAQESIAAALKTGRQLLLTSMASNLDLEDPVQKATLEYVQRVWDSYEPKFTPNVLGRKLSMRLNEEVLALPVLVSLIGFQVENEVAEMRLQEPEFKLRTTALAMHNFESAHGHFPNLAITDDEGKPLMSGRVAMLPYVEQNNLYGMIDPSRSWDEEPNKQLAEMVIPQFMDDEGNMVSFPVFPGSIWDNNGGVKLAEIRDGTSNTIMGVYRPTDQSWADPTPWKISESNPMRDVFGKRKTVNVVMADGSVRTLERKRMNNKKLRAMLTHSGEEVISDD